MTDVLLCQTLDDGEINITGGLVELTGDFRTAVYLSLFGGNEDDDGRDNNEFNWWGNLGTTNPSELYRSETQNLLNKLPPTSNNLLRIEDAVSRDLEWLNAVGAVTGINVTVTVPELNRIRIVVEINGDENVEFLENWKSNTP